MPVGVWTLGGSKVLVGQQTLGGLDLTPWDLAGTTGGGITGDGTDGAGVETHGTTGAGVVGPLTTQVYTMALTTTTEFSAMPETTA